MATIARKSFSRIVGEDKLPKTVELMLPELCVTLKNLFLESPETLISKDNVEASEAHDCWERCIISGVHSLGHLAELVNEQSTDVLPRQQSDSDEEGNDEEVDEAEVEEPTSMSIQDAILRIFSGRSSPLSLIEKGSSRLRATIFEMLRKVALNTPFILEECLDMVVKVAFNVQLVDQDLLRTYLETLVSILQNIDQEELWKAFSAPQLSKSFFPNFFSLLRKASPGDPEVMTYAPLVYSMLPGEAWKYSSKQLGSKSAGERVMEDMLGISGGEFPWLALCDTVCVLSAKILRSENIDSDFVERMQALFKRAIDHMTTALPQSIKCSMKLSSSVEMLDALFLDRLVVRHDTYLGEALNRLVTKLNRITPRKDVDHGIGEEKQQELFHDLLNHCYCQLKNLISQVLERIPSRPEFVAQCGMLCYYMHECFATLYPDDIKSLVDSSLASCADHNKQLTMFGYLWVAKSAYYNELGRSKLLISEMCASCLKAGSNDLEVCLAMLMSILMQDSRTFCIKRGLPEPLDKLYEEDSAIKTAYSSDELLSAEKFKPFLTYLNPLNIGLVAVSNHLAAAGTFGDTKENLYREIEDLRYSILLVLYKLTIFSDTKDNPLDDSQRHVCLKVLQDFPTTEFSMRFAPTVLELYICRVQNMLRERDFRSVNSLTWVTLWYVKVSTFQFDSEEAAMGDPRFNIRQCIVLSWLSVAHIRLQYTQTLDVVPEFWQSHPLSNEETMQHAVKCVDRRGLHSPLALSDTQELLFQSLASRMDDLSISSAPSCASIVTEFVARQVDSLELITREPWNSHADDVKFFLARIRITLANVRTLEMLAGDEGGNIAEIETVLLQGRYCLFLTLLSFAEDIDLAVAVLDAIISGNSAVDVVSSMLAHCYLFSLHIKSSNNKAIAPAWWTDCFGASSLFVVELVSSLPEMQELEHFKVLKRLLPVICNLSSDLTMFQTICKICEEFLHKKHLSPTYISESVKADSGTKGFVFDICKYGIAVPWLVSETSDIEALPSQEDAELSLAGGHLHALRMLDNLPSNALTDLTSRTSIRSEKCVDTCLSYFRMVADLSWRSQMPCANHEWYNKDSFFPAWYVNVKQDCGGDTTEWIRENVEKVCEASSFEVSHSLSLSIVPWEQLLSHSGGSDIFYKACNWTLQHPTENGSPHLLSLLSALSRGLTPAVRGNVFNDPATSDEYDLNVALADDIVEHTLQRCESQLPLLYNDESDFKIGCCQVYLLSCVYNLDKYIRSEDRQKVLSLAEREDTTQLRGTIDKLINSMVTSETLRHLKSSPAFPCFVLAYGRALGRAVVVTENAATEEEESVWSISVPKQLETIASMIMKTLLEGGNRPDLDLVVNVCMLHETFVQLIDNPNAPPVAVQNWVESLGSSSNQSVLFQLLDFCFSYQDEPQEVEGKDDSRIELLQSWLVPLISGSKDEKDTKHLNALVELRNSPVSVSTTTLFADIATLFPREVYRWTNRLSAGKKQRVESFVRSSVSPVVLENQLAEFERRAAQANIRVEGTGLNDSTRQEASPFLSGTPAEFTVKCRREAREIKAIYSQEDAKLSLIITIPVTFPLKQVEVSCDSKIGISESKWRRWELQIRQMMSCSGLFWEALCRWRDSIKKEFEGVEPCPICYSVVHVSNHTLPKTKCQVCNSIFHATCVYKWFRSSGDSKCPMCRSDFF